jgi:hypothetical protein
MLSFRLFLILSLVSFSACTDWDPLALQPDDPAGELAAPSHLEATAPTSFRVDLKWRDNSSAEMEFRIEWKTINDAFWIPLKTLAANSTSYSDTGRQGGKTYIYRVRACNTDGCSEYSNEAFANTP